MNLTNFENNSGPEATLITEENKTISSYKTTSCVLEVKVVSFGGETWNGDVIFKAGNKRMLIIGLHPESSMSTPTVAVRNDVFARGTSFGDHQWVEVTYPAANEDGSRVYNFQFTSSSFVLTCNNTVSNNYHPSKIRY